MLELVLRLPCLLRLLLLLDQRVCVLRLVGARVPRLGLARLVLRRLSVLLGTGRVLAVCRGLQVLSLRLCPFRVLVLDLAVLIVLI